jgi:hypothetical protein
MRISKAWLLGLLAPFAIALACGEDHAEVKDRPDGGAQDGGDAGTIFLACGVAVPQTYDSPSFATNAKEELDLVAAYASLDARMASAEGAGTSVVTSADLASLYAQGTPSLRAASTSTVQAIVDGYLVAFGDAAGKTWTPDLPESEAGAPTGGKYGGAEVVSPIGVSLRDASMQALLGGAMYNHALVIASGPVTEATVDRFVAIWGANEHITTDGNKLVAKLANERDDKSQEKGSFRRMRTALLSAKAAAGAVDKCKADLDASLAVFFGEWERVIYASAIYFLNDAAAKALAQPQNGPVALQSFGAALGLVQAYKGIAPDRRKITDAQIDDIVTTMGSAYAVVTHTTERVPKLVESIQKIQNVYGFTAAEVGSFEKVF